ncbi:tumor necrosis factor receptor superfamily member 1B isoform X2 [Gouania willdenowi]|uniref:tumor necrosis factor receptor superfamily member 1B isoform X2 n=1 Tax=Gouania willdenowi TaxID=441366 RepID=UPI0010552C7F|nr:tumor necrosis factor receptor superfamily member 1B-like isoform X2 [Gouania willdenowi]
MKDLLVLLVLLIAQTLTNCQPYQADSDGKCQDTLREYPLDGSTLCCKKCPPGKRSNHTCSENSETDCVQCDPNLYTESWNYHSKCYRCTKCKSKKGLQYARNCSFEANAKCICQPGMYCIMDFDAPYCTECRKYTMCRPGYGVVTPANSDVVCEQCLSGMFSDTASSTDRCRRHTTCNDRTYIREGTATSDTVCVSTHQPDTQVVLTTATALMNKVLTFPVSVVSNGLRDFTQSAGSSVSEEMFYPSTQSPPPTTEPGIELTGIVGGVSGLILLLIIILLLCLCKKTWRKGAVRLQRKVDANGNTGRSDEVSQIYLEDSQMTSITVTSPEQLCLLEKTDFDSDPNQSKTISEVSPESDNNNSHEPIGPLQSTLPLDSQHRASFEPSLSNSEFVAPQSSTITEPSSQPTSLLVISPVATSPHVNVNITLNIGNGSCGTPSFIPTNLAQENCELPFGEKEESFSMPMQEDGKQTFTSVQESISN